MWQTPWQTAIFVCHDFKNEVRYLAENASSGIVPRLGAPRGNVTGFAHYEATLGGKWLELLSEIAPGLNPTVVTLATALGVKPSGLGPAIEDEQAAR